jgi:hypothetical protein
MLRTVAALATVLASIPSAAAGSGQDGTITVTSPERTVCKNEIRTNTRFARRSCATARDRERQSEEHRRNASELIDRPVVCVTDARIEGCR